MFLGPFRPPPLQLLPAARSPRHRCPPAPPRRASRASPGTDPRCGAAPAGSGSLDQTGVCMCDADQAAVSRLVLRHLEPPPEIVALARDHQQIAGAVGAELVEQVVGGVGVGAVPGAPPASRAPSPSARPPQLERVAGRAARRSRSSSPVPEARGAALALAHPHAAAPRFRRHQRRPPAPAAARRPRRPGRRTSRAGAAARSASAPPAASPGRAYTIAEPLPATITAARGRRSQSTGCDSVGTPCARNQSARSRWVCTDAAPWSLTTRIRRRLQLAPRREPRAHPPDRASTLRSARRTGSAFGIGLVGVAVHRGELGEDEARRPVHRAQQVAGDRVVRRLMPLGVVRHRAPELPLAPRRDPAPA